MYIFELEARFHKKGIKLNYVWESYTNYIVDLVMSELKKRKEERGKLRISIYKQIKATGDSSILEELINNEVNGYEFEFLK